MMDTVIRFFHEYVINPVAKDPIWMSILFVGQFVFAMRFFVQWIASEYKKRSYVPRVFWYLSLVGSLISLTYFVHDKNPILILAFSSNTLIYVRNIHLIIKHSRSSPDCQSVD